MTVSLSRVALMQDRPDGEYENQVTRVFHRGQRAVQKRYEREVRFKAELNALRFCSDSGLTPRLLRVVAAERVILMSEVGGEPLRLDGLPASELHDCIERLASTLRRLHSCRVGGSGDLGLPLQDSWADYLSSKISARLHELEISAKDKLRLESYIQESLTHVNFRTTDALLQHDLKPSNVLLCSDGQVRVIDFDQAKSGDVVSDLAKLRWRMFANAGEALWDAFCLSYFRHDDRSDDLPHLLAFYELLHCVGALAYWHTFRNPDYLEHAASARARVKRQTGVDVPV